MREKTSLSKVVWKLERHFFCPLLCFPRQGGDCWIAFPQLFGARAHGKVKSHIPISRFSRLFLLTFCGKRKRYCCYFLRPRFLSCSVRRRRRRRRRHLKKLQRWDGVTPSPEEKRNISSHFSAAAARKLPKEEGNERFFCWDGEHTSVSHLNAISFWKIRRNGLLRPSK